jgi:outer membrane lipoprotein-sorting protein
MKLVRFARLTLFIGGILALQAPRPCSAEVLTAAKATELRKRFESFQKGTRFWSAHFSQTLTVPGLKTPIVSEGKIWFRSPDSLRIDFEIPAGEWMLTRGDVLVVRKPGKTPSEKPLNSSPAGKPLLGLISLLNGQPVQEADWFHPEVSREGESFHIELVRKEGASSQLPKRISNIVKANSLDVQQVTIHLPNGGSLSYQFEGVERNRTIDPSLFESHVGNALEGGSKQR